MLSTKRVGVHRKVGEGLPLYSACLTNASVISGMERYISILDVGFIGDSVKG